MSISKDMDAWVEANEDFTSVDYLNRVQEATALMGIAGKDTQLRLNIYRGLSDDERKVVRVALGVYSKGALVMQHYSQPRREWISALVGAFALRNNRES